MGTTLLWLAVIVFAVYFNMRAKRHYAQTTISNVNIVLTDSLQDEVLVKSSTVNKWLAESGISIEKTALDSVDLAGIEQTILKNGFIAKANAYVTYDGRLHVEVSQRKPLLRMAVNGYDCYITEEGFLFPTPRLSSVYAPIVTGSYTPPVPAQYVGQAEDYISSLIAQSDERIEQLQHEKVPLFEKEKEIRDSIRKVRTIRISRRFWKELRLSFQPSYQAEYDLDVQRTRAYKAELRRKYRYWLRLNDKAIDAITQRQDAERMNQKKLMKRYEDLVKLINFVKYIEEDSFWRAEIVQIVASTMSNGELQLELIPRSGSHRIRFGTADRVEEKFNQLLAFYNRGLTNIGWEEFKTISVQYNGQIVCTK